MAKNYLLLSVLLLVGLAGVTNAAIIGFQAESGALGVVFVFFLSHLCRIAAILVNCVFLRITMVICHYKNVEYLTKTGLFAIL